MVTTMAAVALAIPRFRERSGTTPLVRFTVAPPFGASRPAGQGFALSPDGKALAFSAIAADGDAAILGIGL